MTIPRILAFLLAFSLLPLKGAAQSGFDMLTIGPNTESLGLNEATTSLLLGASDIYSNPANLALEPSSSLNADYILWIAGLNHTHLAANFRRERSAIAFGLLAEQADDFELRSRPGPSEGAFSVSYFSLAGAYAFNFKNISVGASAFYLREEIYIYDASGYAFNMGITSHWLQKQLYLSAALLSAGRMDPLNLEETELPTQVRTGASFRGLELSGGQSSFPLMLTISSNLVIPLQEYEGSNGNEISNSPYLNFGLAVDAAETIVLRGGYKTGATERPLSFGIGLTNGGIGFNYAMVPFQTGYGTVHSIGLSYRF